jgi:hypothetical protein
LPRRGAGNQPFPRQFHGHAKRVCGRYFDKGVDVLCPRKPACVEPQEVSWARGRVAKDIKHAIATVSRPAQLP